MHTHKTKIFGPPGSGKTTTAIRLITESEVPLEKIAYVTFGRQAMEDMKSRMHAKGISDHSMPYFKTIHGLLFKMLGIRKEQIADMRLAEFCKEKKFDLNFKGMSTEDLGFRVLDEKTLDDEFYAQMQKDRIEMRPFDYVAPNIKKYAGTYFKFKHAYKDWIREHDYIDFIGILERGIREQVIPPVDVLFVDEWQDLNPLQVAVISLWSDNVPKSYHLGDDDQTIYSFSGADPLAFLNFPCDEERVLGETFRLPPDVLALSQNIIKRNVKRHDKQIITNKQANGVIYASIATASRMIRELPNGSSCFVLVRNNFAVGRVMKDLALYGVPVSGLTEERKAVKLMQTIHKKGRFEYEDLDALCTGSVFPALHYFKKGGKAKIKKLLDKLVPDSGYTFEQMLAYGLTPNFFVDAYKKSCAHLKIDSDDLTYIMRLFDTYGYDVQPVRIMTIHQSKGLEADMVILVPDITKTIASVEQGRSVDQDAQESERRVWYTAITRAKKHLVMLHSTNYSNYTSHTEKIVYAFTRNQKTAI